MNNEADETDCAQWHKTYEKQRRALLKRKFQSLYGLTTLTSK
jgi:hypothetical protein